MTTVDFDNTARLAGDRIELRSLFFTSFAKHRERTAISTTQARYTYGEVGSQANRLAHFLLAEGIRPGDVVAVMLPNVPEFVIADQAIIRSGSCKVAVNSMLSHDEQCHVLRVSRARVAIASPAQLPAASTVLAEGADLRSVVVVADEPVTSPLMAWAAVLASHSEEAPEVTVPDGAIGRVSFTGGTTGRPKAIRSAVDRIALNLLSHVLEIRFSADDRVLLASPLAHSAGLFMEAALLVGAAVHLEQRFEARSMLERIERDEVTTAFLVPTMLYRLLDAAGDGFTPPPSLQTIIYGAAPVNRARLEQAIRSFGNVFIQFYGQTEAPNLITTLGRADHSLSFPERLSSCGRAVTMTQVKVVDEAGAAVPTGEIGEVVTRTPYTMIDYMDDAQATSEAFIDGWLKTGDLGWVDADGFVFLVDRTKDMIITGGMNVYCREVERFLATIDGVADAAVFGLPDPDWGEQVVGVVVAAEGATVATEVVLDECRRALAKYKCPKTLRVVQSLPLTAVGKIDKKILRAQWTDS